MSLLQSAGPQYLGGAGLSYLVVVAASEPALFRYLQHRFEPDSSTRVILDRRRRPAPDGRAEPPVIERRRTATAEILSSRRVAVIRLTGDATMSKAAVNDSAGQGRTERMEGMEGLEDRQRVDRWLAESQYLIGRMIPAYLDDRERVRGRLDASERENERLRGELGEARREVVELRAELDALRAERASVAESFQTIAEHLAVLQKPFSEIARHLHATTPATEVHA